MVTLKTGQAFLGRVKFELDFTVFQNGVLYWFQYHIVQLKDLKLQNNKNSILELI